MNVIFYDAQNEENSPVVTALARSTEKFSKTYVMRPKGQRDLPDGCPISLKWDISASKRRLMDASTSNI